MNYIFQVLIFYANEPYLITLMCVMLNRLNLMPNLERFNMVLLHFMSLLP